MDSIVEIRTPTYRRPAFLRRALASLVSQTYPMWRCIVLDDDPSSDEARHVCTEFNDSRIIYTKNETNLGVGSNSNRAFSLDPLPGTTHACVLEDDNYYLPDCLKGNLEIMVRERVDIVLRNQYFETPDSPFNPNIAEPFTRYGEEYVEGIATRDELWGSFFYNIGAIVPSLFWRIGVGLDFCTLEMTDCPLHQERLRTLCIDRPVYIAMDPQIVFHDNVSVSNSRPSYRGIRWHLWHLRMTTRERNICLMLYAYLRAHNLEGHIWQSRLRKIDAKAERVFWRVGIPLQVLSNLTRKDRMTMVAKRVLAKLASRIVVEPVNYKIGKDRIEMCR